MDSASENVDQNKPAAYAGYNAKAAPSWLVNRTADKEAAFFLPHLRSGMSLLDCGCGPGSITLGLAQAVAPGQTLGIDFDPSQIELAQTYAAEQGVATVRFETATIYQLPFPDNFFDAVFSHAVMGHLSEPQTALGEIYRVLKPGGVVGIRNPDFDGILLSPADLNLKRFFDLQAAIIRQKGGNAYIGKLQPTLLHQVGFVGLQTTATCESYGTTAEIEHWANVVSQFLDEQSFLSQFRQFGVETSEIKDIRKTWHTWRTDATAFYSAPWIETIGWKKGLIT